MRFNVPAIYWCSTGLNRHYLNNGLIFSVTGEISALTAAFLWACAAVLYRQLGVDIPPLALNLYKGVIASVLLYLTITGLGQGWGDSTVYGLCLLFLSGIIGIGVGDTAFFASLNKLGERHTILIAETLAPPISVVIAYVFIQERLEAITMVGISITLVGVAWVILERGDGPKPVHSRAGIHLAVIAALSQAIGAVLSREAMTQSEISPWLSTLVRLLGGIAAVILWMAVTRQAFIAPPLKSRRVIIYVFAAAILGTYLGIYFQQVSFKYTSTGIALTLLATSSLFVLLIALIRRERVTLHSVVGVIVAVSGVGLLFDIQGGFGLVEKFRFWWATLLV